MATQHAVPEAFEPMITAEAIAKRIAALGATLSDDYRGKEPVLIGVLKGSVVFMADLVRCMTIPLTLDFLRVSSYEGTSSTGVVRFDFDLTQTIEGRDVLIVEDIVDTGLTMAFLLETLALRRPKSLKVVALLDKPGGRRTTVNVDYVGFTIENRFVIGFGLDLDGLYRNLPEVYAKRKV